MSNKSAKISLVSTDVPLVVSFPQGVPSQVDSVSIEMKRKEISKGKKDKKNYKTIVTGKLNNLVLEDSNTNDIIKTTHTISVGVYDEKTKEISLYFTPNSTSTFVLRPNLEDNQSMLKSANAANQLVGMKRKETLINEFGSKKKKRALIAAKSNTISAENIVSANELGEFIEKPQGLSDEVIYAARNALSMSKKRTNKK